MAFVVLYDACVLYPARFTNALRVLAALVILGSWLLAYRRYIGRIRAGTAKKTSNSA